MGKRSATNKKLEALLRAQKMTALLKSGGIQSQALLDSAGETRPSDESHVVELLETEKLTRVEPSRLKVSRKAMRAKRKPKQKKRR